MNVLSDEMLDKSLLDFLDTCARDYPQYLAYYNAMYYLGIRACEAIEFQRWEFIDRVKIQLQPQKRNDLRFFMTYNLPANFLYILENKNNIANVPSYSQLVYYFNQKYKYPGARIGDKSVSLHLFRHNYVRRLLMQDASEFAIQRILGEKELSSAMQYIKSIVYY